MPYRVESGAAFEAVFESGVSGQAGTVQVKIIDNDGATVVGPTATNISEDGATGLYIWNAPAAPVATGQYSIVWSLDGSFTPAGGIGADDLEVVLVGTGASVLPPIGPDAGATLGPCSAWTTDDEVADCCSVDVGTDPSVFEGAVTSASRILWELSGRLYSGTCDRTLRPCATLNCGFQVLSRGHLVEWDGYSWDGYSWRGRHTGLSACSCTPVSEVLLWYPVREVLEVKIDGAVLAATEYFLYDRRRLVRKNGSFWPGCQRLDLDDTEEGTWSVRFSYGQNPPDIGRSAAAQLACEIYKSCLGLDCALPTGATRVTRQGVTIELQFFQRDPVTKSWRTGLALVDLFLNIYAGAGLRRRPTVHSPDSPRYPRPSPV